MLPTLRLDSVINNDNEGGIDMSLESKKENSNNEEPMIEIKVRPTKRATVGIPTITESHYMTELRRTNRKIVESLGSCYDYKKR